MADNLERVHERRARLRLVIGGGEFDLLVETDVARRRQILAALARPGQPVVDVMRETALPGVEVDSGDALADFSKATAICTATVDLPDPPFSLPTTITRTHGALDDDP